MEYIGEKIIKLQDAKFKTVINNSNEASIFITGNLAEKLHLIENTKKSFKIDKSDLINLLCFTFTFKGQIYKKEKVKLDLGWFEKYLKLINNHFDKGSEFSFDIKKQSQERFYFIGLEQTSGLNIRDLFIQDHIKLIFYKGDTIKIEYSNEIYQDTEIDTPKSFILEESILRQFALKSVKYIVNKYGESFLETINKKITKSVTSDSIQYKTYLFPEYFSQGLLFSFESEPQIDNNRSTPRFIKEDLKLLGENFIYLTTEWAYSGTSNLIFPQLVNFIEKYTNNEISAIKDEEKGTFLLIKKSLKSNISFDLLPFQNELKASGLIFSNQLIQRFIASLCTKPFVIFTGLSGSGKTKLAQAFVQWICQNENQYRIIPVGADWTNREPLLGYPNALKPNEYVKPDNGVLALILQANQQPTMPHFLILDEMNLSHVERYFADFLSVMESKKEIPLHSEEKVENGVPSKLKIPSNLFIIGTVNIDETTNMFSPKVLDRANTIEFRVTQDEMKNFLINIKEVNLDSLNGKGAGMAESFLGMAGSKKFAIDDIGTINDSLVQFFGELKKTGSEFGYRSATEILRLIHQLTTLDPNLTTNKKIDIAIMQKLLPKLHGSRRKLCPVLETLGSFCIAGDVKIIKDVFEKADFDFNSVPVLYPLSLEKIARMYRGAIDNGFASYAEA
jgi:5-methylcytosine-specific restriction protein B